MAIILTDATANANTLTNNGATEVSTSLPFVDSITAIDLAAASSQYLTAADSVSLSQTGDMTLECWVKFTSTPTSGNLMYILSKVKVTGDQRSYHFLLINDAGVLKLQAQILQDGTTTTRDTFRWNWTPTTGTWYHLALTITPAYASATTFEVYVDAVSQGNGTMIHNGNVSAIHDGTARFVIGQTDDLTAGEYFDGKIDEVRVWSTIRTGTQISDNKGVELLGTESGLQAYWPFETLAATGAVAILGSSAFFM